MAGRCLCCLSSPRSSPLSSISHVCMPSAVTAASRVTAHRRTSDIQHGVAGAQTVHRCWKLIFLSLSFLSLPGRTGAPRGALGPPVLDGTGATPHEAPGDVQVLLKAPSPLTLALLLVSLS